MHWDDLEILRLIDKLEETEPGRLGNGLQLLEAAAPRSAINWGHDDREFARELILAHNNGLITWRDETSRNVGVTGADSQPSMWLQMIWTIRLTLNGRDRAKGRVIELPWPDPGEDDGRPITGMTLEEIARALADVYTPFQMPRYLADSGIPQQALAGDPEKRWAYVLAVFERLLDGGSEARRTLRQFIGGWLEGRYHVFPADDIRKRIIALLGQQGWHVAGGRLVVGDRTVDAAGVLTPVGRDARIAALYPLVRQAADHYIETGALDVAVFEAVKPTFRTLRSRSA